MRTDKSKRYYSLPYSLQHVFTLKEWKKPDHNSAFLTFIPWVSSPPETCHRLFGAFLVTVLQYLSCTHVL